jgi:hypothetical protein
MKTTGNERITIDRLLMHALGQTAARWRALGHIVSTPTCLEATSHAVRVSLVASPSKVRINLEHSHLQIDIDAPDEAHGRALAQIVIEELHAVIPPYARYQMPRGNGCPHCQDWGLN